MTAAAGQRGSVVRVNGPLVEVRGLAGARMFDLVALGARDELGEIVRIRGDVATVQVYEYTGGFRPGDPATGRGRALSADLGPGLIGQVFDGLLRPLGGAPERLHPGAERDHAAPARWTFAPRVAAGDGVEPGTVLGVVQETAAVEHRILAPPGVRGRVDRVAPAGEYAGDAEIAVVGGTAVGLVNPWPVRAPRPAAARLESDTPLRTGQRVLDLLFPVALGSTAAVPGGFGTGKTMLLQQIAKWADADVIVYVGCGERGNEMADVLSELPGLIDPRTNRPLMERTVVIANTSNMPVMAREASIYTGITVGEYFRDQGYDAVVIADSTSRWAEALREFASRAGELPVEEGFPASLSSALAAFYERSGRVTTLGGAEASVTVVAAVSPPGGDQTEPVTAHTRRFVRCFWSLDGELAAARHYPAVSWSESFSRDVDVVATGEAEADASQARWLDLRARTLAVLADADRLESIAQLVGTTALRDRERMTLLAGRLLREGVLQQNALNANDAYSPLERGLALLEAMLAVYDAARAAVDRGVTAADVEALDYSALLRAREALAPDDVAGITRLADALVQAIEAPEERRT